MEISLNEINLPLIDEIQSSYKYISNISSGSFGKVIKAIQISTNEEVAIKIIKKNNYNSSLKEEIKILKNCEHKNILKFIDYIETNSKFFIIMELLKGGTLKQFILKNNNLSEEQISKIIKQILSAVNYLHDKNICHRDIKPENIMFKDESFQELKLIDFGLSIKNFYDLGEKDYCGTFKYMAPEILENKIYNKKIDLFSVGIISYELISNGIHPFINNNNNYYTENNIKNYINDIKNFNINKNGLKFSKNFEDFLHRLLEYEPFYRLNAHQALIHPFITRKNEDFKYNNYFEILKKKILKKKFLNVFVIFSFLNYYKKNYFKNNKNNKKNNNNYYIFILNNFKKKNNLMNMKLKNTLIKKNLVCKNKFLNPINKSQSTKNILFSNNINLNINNNNNNNNNSKNNIFINTNNYNNYYYNYIFKNKNKRLSCNNSQKLFLFNHEQKNNFVYNKKLISRQKKSLLNNNNNENEKCLKKYSSISTLPNLQKNIKNNYENFTNKKNIKKNLSKTIINYNNSNNNCYEYVNNCNNSINFINKNNKKYLKSKILLKNIKNKNHSIENLKQISLLVSLSKKNINYNEMFLKQKCEL